MNDIADFKKEYKAQLNSAIADDDMPPALLEQFTFDSCIRKDEEGKKELYLVTRKADGAKALLRITTDYPEEDALHEAKLLDTLDHPAIPKVYATYEQNNRKYAVRQYFDGQTLYNIIKKRGILPARDIYGIASKLCDVLIYLHEQTPPIVHRDIKPQNIIISPDGHIHLVDFGIARVYKPGQKQDTTIILTGPYAPPEQFGFGQTSALTDIYQLGIVMLYLATENESTQDLSHRIKDRRLRQLIEKCTAFDPKARFADARKLKQAVLKAENGKKRRVLGYFFAGAAIVLIGTALFFLGMSRGIQQGRMDGQFQGYDEGYQAADMQSVLQTVPNIAFDPLIGNTNGNIINGAFAVQGPDGAYLILNDAIYTIAAGESSLQHLTDIYQPKGIYYYDGYIYCSSGKGIERVDPNSGQTKIILNTLAEALYFQRDYLYFANAEDQLKLYRVDYDGSRLQKMNDIQEAYYKAVVDDTLYFINGGDNRKLYQCNLDGSNMVCLYQQSAEWLNVYEGSLYFSIDTEPYGITAIDMNSGEESVFSSEQGSCLNFTEAGIYMKDNLSDNQLVYLSPNGKTKLVMSQAHCRCINVTSEWVFYENMDDNAAIWMIRLDGTENQEVKSNGSKL